MFELPWTVRIPRLARLLLLGLAPAALLAGCGGDKFPDQQIIKPPHAAASVQRQEADDLFAQLDRDHDGVLERDEVAGHWRQVFEIMDAEGHGAITAGEFMALPSQKMAGRTTLMEIEDPDRYGAFSRLDANGDGLISLDEFLAVGDGLFDILDRGHKGALTREDLGIPLRERPIDQGILRLPPPPAQVLPPSPVPPPAKPSTAANPAPTAPPATENAPAAPAQPSKPGPAAPPSTAAPPPKPRTLAPSELPPLPAVPPEPKAPPGAQPQPQ